VLALAILPLCAADVTLAGRVVDEDNVPVAGAAVSLRLAEPASNPASVQVVADPTGAFRTTLSGPGNYLVTVTHVDFFTLRDRAAESHEGDNEIVLALNHIRNTSQAVSVSASSPIDIEQTDSERLGPRSWRFHTLLTQRLAQSDSAWEAFDLLQ
jgi:hypothetical protein